MLRSNYQLHLSCSGPVVTEPFSATYLGQISVQFYCAVIIYTPAMILPQHLSHFQCYLPESCSAGSRGLFRDRFVIAWSYVYLDISSS